MKSLGLTDRVSFSGYLADPTEAYARARCLVLTSRLESFGNVVAEGLAHGLPVVSTAAAGPLEILDHGRFGTIVPSVTCRHLRRRSMPRWPIPAIPPLASPAPPSFPSTRPLMPISPPPRR